MNRDRLLQKVSAKTNVRTEDILKLANQLQSKDLKKEANLRQLIQEVSKLAGKPVSKEKEDRIIALVQNNQIPENLENLM
ncbi:hypothetical protein BN3662_00007 [Clostridiales bacterium CHKCI006]|uniref:Stage VI sporulation protein F n=1 Tax=Candidatus Fimiplasma intestinipullorum TaxID=2840825 RepID=A0A9D1L0P7_9FIRM|nr:hypothetical protein BN3662_00007 [Clostridiales bacterium CHKCI006]HIU13286.1 stage VI sporulation protein F [Candidatus Fimiplasma intestinipullorum]